MDKKNINVILAVLSGIVVCVMCVVVLFSIGKPTSMNNENQQTATDGYTNDYDDDNYNDFDYDDDSYEDSEDYEDFDDLEDYVPQDTEDYIEINDYPYGD